MNLVLAQACAPDCADMKLVASVCAVSDLALSPSNHVQPLCLQKEYKYKVHNNGFVLDFSFCRSIRLLNQFDENYVTCDLVTTTSPARVGTQGVAQSSPGPKVPVSTLTERAWKRAPQWVATAREIHAEVSARDRRLSGGVIPSGSSFISQSNETGFGRIPVSANRLMCRCSICTITCATFDVATRATCRTSNSYFT